jgi:hypothetical protein
VAVSKRTSYKVGNLYSIQDGRPNHSIPPSEKPRIAVHCAAVRDSIVSCQLASTTLTSSSYNKRSQQFSNHYVSRRSPVQATCRPINYPVRPCFSSLVGSFASGVRWSKHLWGAGSQKPFEITPPESFAWFELFSVYGAAAGTGAHLI